MVAWNSAGIPARILRSCFSERKIPYAAERLRSAAPPPPPVVPVQPADTALPHGSDLDPAGLGGLLAELDQGEARNCHKSRGQRNTVLEARVDSRACGHVAIWRKRHGGVLFRR